MSRPEKTLDMAKLLEGIEEGENLNGLSQGQNMSTVTLRKRMQQIKEDQGVTLELKEVEELRVTRLKANVLHMLEDNLPRMDVDQLTKALGMLHKMEKKDEGGDSPKGLLGLLSAIEDRAEIIADKKIENYKLESKTFETSLTDKPLPRL